MNIKESIKKFWHFLKQDTWSSWLVSLIILAVIIKLIFFPLISFTTGTQLPLVIVESCSMYHSDNFNSWWDANKEWYENKGITKEQFMKFPLKNGLNKGDILLVWGRGTYNIGDVIIFQSTSQNPVIHRLVSIGPFATKGDHNSAQLTPANNPYGIDETNINQKQIIGKATVKIVPYLGWVKLIWFEPFKDPKERGFC